MHNHRLENIEPYVLDMSLREPATTTAYGQTVEGKLEIFKHIREYGFKDMAIVAWYYGKEYTIEDQFVQTLIDRKQNFRGCFAMYSPGDEDARSKLRYSKIPNVFLEAAYVVNNIRGGGSKNDFKTRVMDEIKQIRDIFSGLKEEGHHNNEGSFKKIILNIVDLCDICDGEQLNSLESFPIWRDLDDILPLVDGLAYEEFRGKWNPKQYASVAKQLRDKLKKLGNHGPLLVHAHDMFHTSDQAAIEAVSAGASGIWAAFTPDAAQGGHNSSFLYLANLVRYGNKKVEQRYKLANSKVMARKLHRIANPVVSEDDMANCPIYGSAAGSLVNSAFDMKRGPDPFDLKHFGIEPAYRIAPMVTDEKIIINMLKNDEIFHNVRSKNPKPEDILRIMRHMLLEGKQRNFSDKKWISKFFAENAFYSNETLPTQIPRLSKSKNGFLGYWNDTKTQLVYWKKDKEEAYMNYTFSGLTAKSMMKKHNV